METCSGSPEQRYLVQTRTRRERIKVEEKGLKQGSSMCKRLPGRGKLVELNKLPAIQCGENSRGNGTNQDGNKGRDQDLNSFIGHTRSYLQGAKKPILMRRLTVSYQKDYCGVSIT